MAKQLKYWNGRGCGKYFRTHNINVAAYSKKQAAEIITIATNGYCTVSEITVYFFNCWGSKMNGIKPEYPSVYVEENKGNNPPKLIYTHKN